MKAVVMAAGRGIRLRPLTLTRPKHMIPVAGSPLLEWTMTRLREAGIREVIVVVHHLEEKIRNHFGDGSRHGLRIVYVRQRELGGTADAFRAAEPLVGDEEFLGLNGDLYLQQGSIKAMVDAHRAGETTIAVVPVENPWDYGAVELDGDSVRGIVEKPERGKEPSHLANAGIYVFTPRIFEKIVETKPSKRGEYEVTDSLGMLIEDGEPVRAVALPRDAWLDIGLPWHFLDANERALGSMSPCVEGEVEEGARLIGPIVVRAGSKIRSGAYIEGPVFIGDGSDIGPNCYIRPHTSVGAGVRIGNACEVKNSIIMDGTHVAHLSYVGDSIIGEGCNLGAGTITANIRFDKRPIKVNIEGRRVDSGRRKLGALIGDDAQTGINVSLMPGVKVGSGAWIAPGLVVYEDIPEGVLLSGARSELKAEKHP